MSGKGRIQTPGHSPSRRGSLPHGALKHPQVCDRHQADGIPDDERIARVEHGEALLASHAHRELSECAGLILHRFKGKCSKLCMTSQRTGQHRPASLRQRRRRACLVSHLAYIRAHDTSVCLKHCLTVDGSAVGQRTQLRVQ